jgi:hypothetical protein
LVQGSQHLDHVLRQARADAAAPHGLNALPIGQAPSLWRFYDDKAARQSFQSFVEASNCASIMAGLGAQFP